MKTKRAKKTTESVHGLPRTPVLGISALEGAAAGAAVGAFAGPIGAIVGGAIGSAVGVAAGAAMENADEARSKHDHELDQIIGIEGGDMGSVRPPPPPPPPKKDDA